MAGKCISPIHKEQAESTAQARHQGQDEMVTGPARATCSIPAAGCP